ncbi:hypothetical protein Acy02nite_90900 [Actinoplanes cyaneus]|uniref:Uncharacterized protein n=1 Tax=Actinoplanes cyaneus TaxID=52696 RepID=A0A919MD10_9ACTN|nr:hypothetical protein Acy02nite_90900 [Actinoplanes cyaneus]
MHLFFGGGVSFAVIQAGPVVTVLLAPESITDVDQVVVDAQWQFLDEPQRALVGRLETSVVHQVVPAGGRAGASQCRGHLPPLSAVHGAAYPAIAL